MTGTTDLEPGVTLPCWTASPDLWFAEAPADVEAAKAIGQPRPQRADTLAGAVELGAP